MNETGLQVEGAYAAVYFDGCLHVCDVCSCYAEAKARAEQVVRDGTAAAATVCAMCEVGTVAEGGDGGAE